MGTQIYPRRIRSEVPQRLQDLTDSHLKLTSSIQYLSLIINTDWGSTYKQMRYQILFILDRKFFSYPFFFSFSFFLNYTYVTTAIYHGDIWLVIIFHVSYSVLK